MTFVDKQKNRVIGHLEDIIEDFQNYEEELTLREKASTQMEVASIPII
jgi:hypothetical protein